MRGFLFPFSPQPVMNHPEHIRINFHYFTIISYQPVQLIFYVRKLRINRGRKSAFNRRFYLSTIQLQQSVSQFHARRQPFITEIRLVERVIRNSQVIPSELRQRHRPAPAVRRKSIRTEINMPAKEIAAALIKPSAGGID